MKNNLQWFEVPDTIYGLPGWSLHVGCEVEQEPGDAPTVRIREAVVNTGQRELPLTLAEIPYWEWESLVSEMIEDRQLSERAA